MSTLYTVLTTDPQNVGFAPYIATRNDVMLTALLNDRTRPNPAVTVNAPVVPSAAGLMPLLSKASLTSILSSGVAPSLQSSLLAGDVAQLGVIAAAAHAVSWITDAEFSAVQTYLASQVASPASSAEASNITPYGVPITVDQVSHALNNPPS